MSNNSSSKFPAGSLARPDYRPGEYLLADDVKAGQQYLQQRFRRHDRMLHGPGVICGLRVVPANDPGHPWGVFVCPGYAIGPYGDEIELRRRELLDIEDSLWMNFSTPGLPQFAFVGISYAEKLIKPVPAPMPLCQCDETTYVPSRIKDSHQLAVLWTGIQERRRLFDMCAGEVMECEPCPESPYLLLARINLPVSVGNSIVAASIVNL